MRSVTAATYPKAVPDPAARSTAARRRLPPCAPTTMAPQPTRDGGGQDDPCRARGVGVADAGPRHAEKQSQPRGDDDGRHDVGRGRSTMLEPRRPRGGRTPGSGRGAARPGPVTLVAAPGTGRGSPRRRGRFRRATGAGGPGSRGGRPAETVRAALGSRPGAGERPPSRTTPRWPTRARRSKRARVRRGGGRPRSSSARAPARALASRRGALGGRAGLPGPGQARLASAAMSARAWRWARRPAPRGTRSEM